MMKNERGVTLVELLLTVALMVIVLTPILTLVTLFMQTQVEVVENSQLQHEARLILELFTNKVNQGAIWDDVQLELVEEGQPMIRYEPEQHRIVKVDNGVTTLSELVSEFEVLVDAETGEWRIYLSLGTDRGESYALRTSIFARARHIIVE